MPSGKDEQSLIKNALSESKNGMTVTEIARAINMSRNSVAKYLEMLMVSGHIEMKKFGPSKVFYLSERVPVSSMLGLSSDLIVTLDRDLKIVQANDKFLKLVGMDAVKVQKRSVESAHIPLLSDRELVMHLKNALDGREFALEICVKKGRKDLYFNAKIIPAVFDNGNRGVAMILEDITSRKYAEQELQKAHDELERKVAERTAELGDACDQINTILESISDSFISCDAEWRLTYMNGECEKLFGIKREEVIGKVVWDLMPEYISDKFRARFELAKKEQIIERVEVYFNFIGKWYEISMYPFRGGFSCYFQDITERKQVEEARSMMASIVESSDDAIIGRTLDDIITSWNGGAERMYGYTSREVLGQSGTVIIPHDRIHEIPDILNRIKQGERVFHYETERVRKDGRQLTISLTMSPIFDTSGNIIGASSISRDITDQKLAHAALEEAGKLNRAVLDSLEANIAVIDSHGNILDTNRSWDRYAKESGLSMPRLMIKGANLFELLSEAAEKGVKEALQSLEGIRSVATGKVQSFDIEYPIDMAGRKQWLFIRAMPLSDGNNTKVVVTWLDVTDRKTSEKIVIDSFVHYHQLLDALPVLVWQTNRDGKCSYVNKSWLDLTGRQIAGMLGDRWMEIIHPDDREMFRKSYDCAVKNRVPFKLIYRIVDCSGNYRWVANCGRPLEGTGDQFAGYIGVCYDITDSKQAEDILRESEEKYRTLFNSAGDRIILIDIENGNPGRILEANDYACRMLGYKRDELTGLRITEIVTPWNLKELPAVTEEIIAQGYSVFEVEEVARDGHRRPVEVMAYKFRMNGRDVALAIARDITHRKKNVSRAGGHDKPNQ